MFSTKGFLFGGKTLGRHGDVWVSSSQAICVVVRCPKDEAAWKGQTHTHTQIEKNVHIYSMSIVALIFITFIQDCLLAHIGIHMHPHTHTHTHICTFPTAPSLTATKQLMI